ncbi:hypothetical protein J4Q44_G00267970 [Coregonus suidteri]|uniref:Uncharacterized protein n=1 Tax=Coregonus suidteri TaxID=861788 RepID=A0AAN8L493_9TELE
MAALMDTRILLRKMLDLQCLTPRRNRVKAKWDFCVSAISVFRTYRLRRVLKKVKKDYASLPLTAGNGPKSRGTPLTESLSMFPAPQTDTVMEDENNLFKRARRKGRLRLPPVQTELLLAGMEAVGLGVEVLYSTCYLSQLQNECVVEQDVHRARKEHGISLQVADLRPLTRLFKDTFHLAPDLDLG